MKKDEPDRAGFLSTRTHTHHTPSKAKAILILDITPLRQRRQRRLLDHRGRPTQKHDAILGRLEQRLLDDVGVDVALLPLPLFAGVTQHMRHFKLPAMLPLEPVQGALEQDVRLALVRVDDAQLRCVASAEEHAHEEGVAGRDAGAAEDEADAFEVAVAAFDGEVAVAVVDNVARGPADLDLLAEGHAIEDVGEGAAGLFGGGEVRLHGEVKRACTVALGVCVGRSVGFGGVRVVLLGGHQGSRGRVAADHHAVLEVVPDLDVLAGAETEHFLAVGERKGVRSGIFGD